MKSRTLLLLDQKLSDPFYHSFHSLSHLHFECFVLCLKVGLTGHIYAKDV